MRVHAHVWVSVAWAGIVAGCLRDTSHPCEAPGACGSDVDARADAADDTDGAVNPIDATIDDPWGDGHHGDVVLDPLNVYINSYGVVRSDALAGATLVVAARQSSSNIGFWSNGFEVGDRIMIWRTTGLPDPATSGSTTPVVLDSGVGRWFVTRIVDRNADRLTIADPLPFDLVADLAQVIKLPELDVVTMSPGTSISARDWQGQYGGLVGFYANEVTISGATIEASADGFNGGTAVNYNDFDNCSALDGQSSAGGGAPKGESFVLTRFGTGNDARAGRGNIYHGGGGGDCRNAGGGGGAHVGVGGGGANDDVGRTVGGLPGAPLRYSPATHLATGGGAGAGENNSSAAGEGGWGGGVVWLTVRTITCTGGGELAAYGGDGGDATDDGAGGGGAGGLVWIRAENVNGCSIGVNGGDGGTTTVSWGPGGGGGGGKIVIVADTATGIVPDAAGGAAGTGSNGQTRGAVAGQPGAICGNGTIETGETCDDGSYQPGDACRYCSE